MEAAPQIQKLSITNQAMDWSGIAVARSSFHATCIFEYYNYIFHLMCAVVVDYHGMASLPMLSLVRAK